MRVIRVPFDSTTIAEGRVRISGADARHVVKVLRATKGEQVIAFAGDGREWDAVIDSVGPTSLTLALGPARAARPESPCAILLGQGVGKGEKLDLVVRAATELGVAEIVPVATARAIAEGEGRATRLQRIASESCKQCGRAKVPVVHPPESLAAFLARAKGAELKVVPWEGGGIPLAEAARGGAKSAAILIGPEGGLEAREVEAAKAAGFIAVTLGPRVLRTETAGIVAVAALQLLVGDMR